MLTREQEESLERRRMIGWAVNVFFVIAIVGSGAWAIYARQDEPANPVIAELTQKEWFCANSHDERVLASVKPMMWRTESVCDEYKRSKGAER